MSDIETVKDFSAPIEARIEAARALAKSKPKDARSALAIDALATAIQTADEQFVEEARTALKALGAAAVLARVLLDSTASPQAKMTAANGLRYLRDPGSVTALRAGLGHSDSGVRRASAHALTVFGAAQARGELERALTDDSAEVRYFALLALSQVNESRPTLEGRVGKETDAVLKDELARILRG